jgi:hypothetical protein
LGWWFGNAGGTSVPPAFFICPVMNLAAMKSENIPDLPVWVIERNLSFMIERTLITPVAANPARNALLTQSNQKTL